MTLRFAILALSALALSLPSITYAQPIAVDTLFAPSPTIIKNFGHTLQTLSPSGSDSLFAFINEPQRSPDSVVDVFVYDVAKDAWTVEDSLGWNTGLGDFGEGSISSMSSPDGVVVAMDNDGFVALWRLPRDANEWVLEQRLDDIEPGGTAATFGSGIDCFGPPVQTACFSTRLSARSLDWGDEASPWQS